MERAKHWIVGIGCMLLACGGGDESSTGRTSGSVGQRPPAGGGPGSTAGTTGSGPGFGNTGQNTAGSIAVPQGGAQPTPSDICEVVQVNANPQTPDMLIVLDRSGSMIDGGRWQPSVSALRRVTMELESQIRFGLAMFPDPGIDPNMAAQGVADCLIAPDPNECLNNLLGVCSPGRVVVPIEIDNAGAIGGALDMTVPAGGTPTGETLEGLLDMFTATPSGPDTTARAQFILLVTDGQPTCPAGRGMDTTQEDIDRSNVAIEALTSRGVLTYVIGYDTTGPGNEMFASVLDGFAQRGGTGDMQHRPVEDEQSLLSELQRIAGEVVSCSFVLESPPPQADHVLVQLDGNQINLGDPDGWQLVGDRTVELTGAACERLKSTGQHHVEVEVRCEVVTPI